MAVVVGFISEKGGVGKTTACYHVAVALNRYHGQRVLVIDADYQRGGITGRFFPAMIEAFGSGAMPGTTLFHKFQQLYSASPLTPDVDIKHWSDGRTRIDVLPADPRLASVSIEKLPSNNNIRENNLSILRHMQVIDLVLRPLQDSYDYILIDSHPEVSAVLRSIIYAADCCVSPVKLDRQSSIGVATVLGEINNVNADVEMIQRSVGGIEYADTVFAGSMGMMAREWGESLKQSEHAEYNRLRGTGAIFSSYVTEGDGLRQAAAQRVPVYDITIANATKQSRQFRDLAVEFLQVWCVMNLNIETLIEWLGPEGAVAGLERGKLTQADLMVLAREQRLKVDKRASRKQLAIELVMSRVERIDRPPEQLLGMNADELRKYFAERMASSSEILKILDALGIAPGGSLRGKLSDFAAREISDLGMFKRVAKGQPDR